MTRLNRNILATIKGRLLMKKASGKPLDKPRFGLGGSRNSAAEAVEKTELKNKMHIKAKSFHLTESGTRRPLNLAISPSSEVSQRSAFKLNLKSTHRLSR
jgi:hypothetical protein